MQCFLCKKTFISAKALINHIQVYHSLSAHSEYVCCEKSCGQAFSSVQSFRRHLKKKHSNTSQNKILKTEKSVKNKNKSFSEIISETKTLDSDNEKIKFFSKDSFYEMVARFCVKLNNNNNFSRKNVFEITTLVKNTFVYPAITYLKTICNEIENKETKSNLQNFIMMKIL